MNRPDKQAGHGGLARSLGMVPMLITALEDGWGCWASAGRHRAARGGEHAAQSAPHLHLHQGHARAAAAAAHPLMSVLLRLARRDGGGAVPGLVLRVKGLGS